MHSEAHIKTDDGSCPAHVFHPDGAGPFPAVLMYMDGIGMRPAIVHMGERLASAGFYVLLPDLFYRAGAYTAPEPKKLFTDENVRKDWFSKVFTAASVDKIMRDTRAFLAHMDGDRAARAHKIGVTGYCMGGRLALSAAGHFPDRVAAAAAFHPGGLATDQPDSPHLLAGKIRARVYVGGAMEDQSFPDEQKQKLEQALTAAKVDHTIVTYEARHGWVPSDTPVHDPAQADRHWKALTELMTSALGR